MIIVMKPGAPKSAVDKVEELIVTKGLEAHLSQGKEVTIIGVVGNKNKLLNENIELMPFVDKIVPVTESYKLTNKKFHPEPSRIKVGDVEIGPDTLTVMAGPCAVENEEQLMTIAREVKKAGAQFVRGGAYKPRTSPYSFQGLEEEGLKYMAKAGREFGLKTICEVISAEASQICGYDSDRRPQYAEFSASAGSRPVRPAGALEKRTGRHHRRMAQCGGVHHLRRQFQRRPLREGDPHL